MRNPARILVVRTGALGDVVLTLPAIAAIRDALADAEIHLLGNPGRLGLARHLGVTIHDIDRGEWAGWFSPSESTADVLARNPLRSLLSNLDLVISYLPDSDSNFSRNLLRAGVDEVITHPPHPPADGSVHAVDHLLSPLASCGWTSKNPTPEIVLTDCECALAHSQIPNTEGPLLVVHPGSGGSHKCWPAERFAQAADRIAAELKADVLITGGPADGSLPDRVAALMSARAGCLNPETPRLFAAVLAQATVYLGNDSGPSHLAAAVGTPVVALFGPTDPSTWAPRGNVRVLKDDDLNAIAVETVVAAALAGTASPSMLATGRRSFGH